MASTDTFDPRWQIKMHRKMALDHALMKVASDQELAAALKIILGRSHEARVQVTPAVAVMWARLHGAVNSFDPQTYAQLLRAIDQALPRKDYGAIHGMPNINNGGYNYRLEIGTESSEVLYVRFGEYRYVDSDLSLLQRRKAASSIYAAARAAGADEIHYLDEDGNLSTSLNDEHSAGLRIWWD